jgi:hypothetical protein
VTNVARPDAPQRVDARDVLDSSAAAAPKVAKIVLEVLKDVGEPAGGVGGLG